MQKIEIEFTRTTTFRKTITVLPEEAAKLKQLNGTWQDEITRTQNNRALINKDYDRLDTLMCAEDIVDFGNEIENISIKELK